MPDRVDNQDKIRAILVLLATLGVIVFNVLATQGYVNGITTGEISDKYPTAVTPAGYAFSIWSLIYTGILAFSVYQLLPANAYRFRPARTPYIVSCVLNCAWIYFWHQENILLCLVIIFALGLSLIRTYRNIAGCRTQVETLVVQAPFGLYAGWVTAASLVNLAVALRYLEVGQSPQTVTVLSVILILAAAAIGIAARFRLRNFFFPLAIAWALTAIAIKQSGQTAIVVASAIGVIASLIAALSFVLNLNDNHHE